MSIAITTSTPSACTTGGAPAPQPSGLDADLAKAQSELADWVHCPSSKTPEGKAKIEEVSAKVDAIKVKMHKAEETVKATKHTEAAVASPPAAPALVFSGLGSYLNVYA